MSTVTAAAPQTTIAARPTFKSKYDHYIGGEWVAPSNGEYFDNISPLDGKVFTQAARGNAKDIEKAIDAATEAFQSWGKSAAAYRSNILLKIAQVIEDNLDYLAIVETIDNGKAIRETRAADLPLVVDHFRYFAGVLRSEEGSISEHDDTTVSINLHEPIGVVGQIIPWNFPLLMAAWKIAPALAAGCTVIVKPAEQTPTSIMCLMELIGDLLPKGVLNIVTGFGPEAGKPLATSPRINKVAFTGETTTGRLIMQYASENLIPVTMELGGKSPNIFFESVADADDEFFDKAVEGAVMFALNQGEVCTCPSRILVHEKIYDKFMSRVVKRAQAIKMGNPLDSTVMMGAQASEDQYKKILSYFDIGKQEGAEVLCGGEAFHQNSGLEHGYYIKPTILKGHNKMRVFQEEIFGPVTSVTTFKTTQPKKPLQLPTIHCMVWVQVCGHVMHMNYTRCREQYRQVVYG
jgi:aldehyde dehydrogenase